MGHLPLQPLHQSVQMGERVYQALADGIVSGRLRPGTRLRVDAIAQQLGVSTTPVRDALGRLEKDGLITKYPYHGALVRVFKDEEVRELYELRAGLECFGVRMACRRIADSDIAWLREHQRAGMRALERGDMESYRMYNQELHAAILHASGNNLLVSTMETISRQMQVLTARAIRVSGRPTRACQEHEQLIELIAKRDAVAADKLMEHHILSALDDVLRHRSSHDERGNDLGQV